MNDPTVLRDALLEDQFLSQLPDLLAHLNGHTPERPTPAVTRFLDDLCKRAAMTARSDPDPTNASEPKGAQMSHPESGERSPTTHTDQHDSQHQQQIEAETSQVRGRALLEETRRTEEALRQAGYDSPVTERTRPATPRPPR